jgi:hypothetical protein
MLRFKFAPTSSQRMTMPGSGWRVQAHGLTADATDLETWRGMSYQTVLTPPDEKTGSIIYPYEKAQG